MQQFFLGGRYPTEEDVTQAWDALIALDAANAPVAYEQVAEQAKGVAANKLKVGLKLLKDAGHVKQDRSLRYRLIGADTDVKTLARLADEYKRKSESDRQKLERMIFYAQTAFCRWKVLLEYFEEAEDFDHCGVCDNCTAPQTRAAPPKTSRPRWARRLEAAEPAFRNGERVRVPRYGEGRVKASTSEQVEIVFPDGRTRAFLPAFVSAV